LIEGPSLRILNTVQRISSRNKLLSETPFPVRGIQVDGGAEFKSVFEAECQVRGLELFVLPPKRPDFNGCVERAQSTWRYEFYATYDLPHWIDKITGLRWRLRPQTTGRTTPLQEKLRQSISKLSAKAIYRRLIIRRADPTGKCGLRVSRLQSPRSGLGPWRSVL
jgi:hypothetical protein